MADTLAVVSGIRREVVTAAKKAVAMAVMAAAEGIWAVVLVAVTKLAMALADNSGNDGTGNGGGNRGSGGATTINQNAATVGGSGGSTSMGVGGGNCSGSGDSGGCGGCNGRGRLYMCGRHGHRPVYSEGVAEL